MAVINIKISEPQFEGQTKAKLGNSEAKSAVESVLSEKLEYFLEENPSVGKTIFLLPGQGTQPEKQGSL